VIESSQATRDAERAETLRADEASRAACRVCGNAGGNRLHRAREMFAGTREEFTYVECAACGTLQLRDVPDLARYYSDDYYSFRADSDAHDDADASLRRRLRRRLGAFTRRRIAAYLCARRGTLGAARHPLGWLASRVRAKQARDFPAYLRDTRLRLNFSPRSAILDVGSGAGATLLLLRGFGFRDLTGIDPFLDADIVYDAGTRVLKTELSDLKREFDLVLANHSIEHVAAPRAALAEINRLLRRGHYAVVRTPVVARAWESYKTDWVQLDAPRHLFIFNAATFIALASDAGFSVDEVRYDSTAFQFWGSELYARDIPLSDARSYFANPDGSIFSRAQINAWEEGAQALNARGEGDQAIFYLRKK
jgi:SAM-dependent methyltransferase